MLRGKMLLPQEQDTSNIHGAKSPYTADWQFMFLSGTVRRQRSIEIDQGWPSKFLMSNLFTSSWNSVGRQAEEGAGGKWAVV